MNFLGMEKWVILKKILCLGDANAYFFIDRINIYSQFTFITGVYAGIRLIKFLLTNESS